MDNSLSVQSALTTAQHSMTSYSSIDFKSLSLYEHMLCSLLSIQAEACHMPMIQLVLQLKQPHIKRSSSQYKDTGYAMNGRHPTHLPDDSIFSAMETFIAFAKVGRLLQSQQTALSVKRNASPEQVKEAKVTILAKALSFFDQVELQFYRVNNLLLPFDDQENQSDEMTVENRTTKSNGPAAQAAQVSSSQSDAVQRQLLQQQKMQDAQSREKSFLDALPENLQVLCQHFYQLIGFLNESTHALRSPFRQLLAMRYPLIPLKENSKTTASSAAAADSQSSKQHQQRQALSTEEHARVILDQISMYLDESLNTRIAVNRSKHRSHSRSSKAMSVVQKDSKFAADSMETLAVLLVARDWMASENSIFSAEQVEEFAQMVHRYCHLSPAALLMALWPWKDVWWIFNGTTYSLPFLIFEESMLLSPDEWDMD